jgi:hypothetical protein
LHQEEIAMDEREMFENALQAVYEGKAVMKVTLFENGKIIELSPIVDDSWEDEEGDDE